MSDILIGFDEFWEKYWKEHQGETPDAKEIAQMAYIEGFCAGKREAEWLQKKDPEGSPDC